MQFNIKLVGLCAVEAEDLHKTISEEAKKRQGARTDLKPDIKQLIAQSPEDNTTRTKLASAADFYVRQLSEYGGFMKHKIIQITKIILLLFLVSIQPNILASDNQNIPDAVLRVTVQQKELGKLNQDLHIQELICFKGECSLTTITLNSCRPSPVSSGMASPVIVERLSTREGNLQVTNEGDTLVTVETGFDIGGDSVTTQRFKYEKPRNGEMVTKLIGYSGGFVKNSILLQRVVIVEYVPFIGAYKEIKLDCPLALPGLDISE